MGTHPTHNMQLTSLWCKFGSYTESQYNEKFRNHIEKHIIQIHSCMPTGLTDEELGEILKIKLDQPNLDTDVYRPRRSDLSKVKKGKRLRPNILTNSGRKRLNKHGRHCIVWIMNIENLQAWMTQTP